MTFIASNLIKLSVPVPFQPTTVTGVPQIHLPALYGYATATDNIATVGANNYFNTFAKFSYPAEQNVLGVGDQIFCICTDGNQWRTVDSITNGIVTVVTPASAASVDTAEIVDDAVTTAKIADANVTLAKLATGIAPSHVVKFAGQPTTVGGAAAEAFAVAGVLATDKAFVQIVDNGTANVTALQAVCTANTLTVTFSANPGNDCVFNYQILRAAV